MACEFEIGRLTLDMTVFGIDNDIAFEVPDAVFEVELACTALVGLYTDATLCQPQATKHQHRALAVVVGGIGIKRDRQPEVAGLRAHGHAANHCQQGDAGEFRQVIVSEEMFVAHIPVWSLGDKFAADIGPQLQLILLQQC